MASINVSLCAPSSDDQIAWNQAYDRLENFLNTFALSDRAQVLRLTLKITDQAREIYLRDSSLHPTVLVMEQTQKLVTEWLTSNLNVQENTSPQAYSSGNIAMILSQAFRIAPDAFLVSTLPENLRQSMRQILVSTGPDLDISSMAPRPIDYGPMLDLAKKTWHRWNTRSIFIALLFWTGVYFFFYFWLSDYL